MNTQLPLSTDKRLVWADALRGLLILLVVLGHSLQHGDYENRLSWNIIYSFHMAAFFMISGYVNYKSEFSYTTLKKRAVQLLLPFLTWTLLNAALSPSFTDSLVSVVLRPDNSYWFIYVLFVITLIHMLLTKLSKALGVNNLYLVGGGIIFLTGLMVIFNWRILGFQFIAYYFTFYAIGHFIRLHELHFTKQRALLMGFLWLGLALFWRMHSVPLPLQGITFIPDNILTYGYRFLTAVVGSLFCIGAAQHLFQSKSTLICRVLCYLGTISLGIYIIHLFIGRFFGHWFINLFPSDTCLTYVCVNFTLKLFISLCGILIIKRIPILSILFLGKK